MLSRDKSPGLSIANTGLPLSSYTNNMLGPTWEFSVPAWPPGKDQKEDREIELQSPGQNLRGQAQGAEHALPGRAQVHV